MTMENNTSMNEAQRPASEKIKERWICFDAFGYEMNLILYSEHQGWPGWVSTIRDEPGELEVFIGGRLKVEICRKRRWRPAVNDVM